MALYSMEASDNTLSIYKLFYTQEKHLSYNSFSYKHKYVERNCE